MIIILLTINFILLLICIFLLRYILNLRNNIKYICVKLKNSFKSNSFEKILLTTNDGILINLLLTLNEFIKNSQEISAKYTLSTKSMKKMLSNISHDIKTPLTVIYGYLELINTNKTLSKEEILVYISKIQNKNIELMDLINRFFNLAKLESGDVDIPLTRINVTEICKQVILSFYEILSSKDFKVEIDIPDSDIYILGNEISLKRILNNLINNAIRYGYEGKYLKLSVLESNGLVHINITDKGKGIKENDFDRIFERLYTLEDSRNSNFQGSGLGLTITKNLVTKLHGKINVTSIPYNNTTFSITFKTIKII